MFEITMRRPRNPKVALHFLIDVDETRRRPHAGLDRKAESVRLPRPVIGVLAQNHHAHILRRRRVERGEPVARARKDRLALAALLAQKLLERRHIGLLELAADAREPVGTTGRHWPPDRKSTRLNSSH